MSIQLKSSDDEIYSVNLKTARQSGTIKTILEDVDFASAGANEPIPIPNVNSVILKKVIEWCSFHQDDPPNVDDDDKSRPASVVNWEKEFLLVDNKILIEIILAANYLDIPHLLKSGCKAVANIITGKTPDEIRQTFDLMSGRRAEDEEEEEEDEVVEKEESEQEQQ